MPSCFATLCISATKSSVGMAKIVRVPRRLAAVSAFATAVNVLRDPAAESTNSIVKFAGANGSEYVGTVLANVRFDERYSSIRAPVRQHSNVSERTIYNEVVNIM